VSVHEVDGVGGSSPCGGRSESPSQRHVAAAESGQSRAAQPPSGAREPFTAREPGQSEAETVTESDQSGGGPCGGREDEPERPAAKRRTVKVQMEASTAAQVEQLARGSGLARAHFMATALLLGARRLTAELVTPKREAR
jgi:hypothetical protein